jgi:hypothetical protein
MKNNSGNCIFQNEKQKSRLRAACFFAQKVPENRNNSIFTPFSPKSPFSPLRKSKLPVICRVKTPGKNNQSTKSSSIA